MKNKALFLLASIILSFAPCASADITLSANDFVQNTDGTVTHTPTGLIWQACSVGQTWDGTNGTCTGTATLYTYYESIKVMSDFAGKTDWRIPNIVELNTLVDLKQTNPAINKSLFPQTQFSTGYISSMLFAGGDNKFWLSGLSSGVQYASSTASSYYYYLRLVRGKELPTKLVLSDFKDNNDGSVTHLKTGLIWQRCSVGQTWGDGGCTGPLSSYRQSDAVKLTSDLGGNMDWRLPSYKELLTLVDFSQYGPATSAIIFPDTPNGYFWTSTDIAGTSNNNYAWFIDFSNGQGGGYAKTNGNYVRLVRGSMTTNSTIANSGGIDLSTTISSAPNPATVNGNMSFTATLTNKGILTATGVKLSFALPKNSVSLIAKPTECSFTGLSVLCSVGNLAPSGSVSKSVTVKMAKAGGLTFGVTSWAAEKDTNTADNVARTTIAIRK